MTTEEKIEFLEGQNLILKNTLSLLIVMHPNKEELITHMNKLASYPEVLDSSETYQNGIKNILQAFADLSTTALHAKLAASQERPKSEH